jgi:hypothetical protein
MNKYLKNWFPVRITLGVIVVLMEIGSALQGDWGTAISAMIFVLFLTINPDAIKDKLKLNYGLAFTFMLFAFVISSNQTMSAFEQETSANVTKPTE